MDVVLNWGLSTCYAGALTLEPHFQPNNYSSRIKDHWSQVIMDNYNKDKKKFELM
jgi:hypothetical protein